MSEWFGSKPNGERHPEGRVTTERRGHVLLIGLDRQEKLNSFTPKMHAELQSAYVLLDDDPDLRAGVVFGHGKCFSAGLDLPKFMSLLASGRSPIEMDKVDPWSRWIRCRKPVVAAPRGVTYTAGLELILGSDIIIAADDCRFSQLEPKRGIMSSAGGISRFVERGGWGNAMYHLLTCDEFGAAEAYRIGIAQEVVAAGQELERAVAIAARIAANAPLAVQATKANALISLHEGERTALEATKPDQARLMDSEDAAEGLRSFVEKRLAEFTGR